MKAKYIVGIVVAIAFVAVAVFAVTEKGIAYMDFHTAAESGARAQVAGTWVREKETWYDSKTNQFHFTLRDTSGTQMPVVLDGAKPNNFELAVSVVATGSMEGDRFHATNVLTKCPSKYESTGKELESYDGHMGKSNNK
jgi:cytochrome c-type biogenesis protein CcmE